MSNWTNLMNGGAVVRAIGEPGEPGDPDRIQHLAERLNSTYMELMDWSARLRGARRPKRYARLVSITARFADQPIQEYRAWVAEVLEQTDRVQSILAKKQKQPVTMTMTLTLSIAPEVMAEHEAEMARLNSGAPDLEEDE